MKKIYTVHFALIAILVFCFLFTGCTQKPISLGSNDKVAVIADSALWGKIDSLVRKAIEKERFTPQPERIFSIILHQPEKLAVLTRYPHILFLGTLDQEGDTKQLLDNMLSPEARKKVEQDSLYIFQKNDPWSKNQLLIVLVSRDLPTLQKRLRENENSVFQIFDSDAQKLVHNQMYGKYEKKEIGKKLFKEHDWTVRVQRDFVLAMDSTEAKFVWLRRINPQREFFVYWQSTNDPSILSREWIIETRDNLTKDFYAGDFIFQDDDVKAIDKIVDFRGRYAILLDGVWQNEKHMIGGPFRSYAFYDESQGRLYLVDSSVFAPGEHKWPYMRQVIAMANTFRTDNDRQDMDETGGAE